MYSELEAAKNWGMSPREWYSRERDERAMILGFERVRAKVEQVQIEESK
jgi:hypothetical protein